MKQAVVLAAGEGQRLRPFTATKPKAMLGRENNWRNPFGDGKAGERIVEVIMGGNNGR